MDELEGEPVKAPAPQRAASAPRAYGAAASAPTAASARSSEFSLEDQLLAELGGDVAAEPPQRRQPEPAQPPRQFDAAFDYDDSLTGNPVGAGRSGAILATRVQQGRRSADTEFDRLSEELEASFSDEPDFAEEADDGYYEEEYVDETPAERPPERQFARPPAHAAAPAPPPVRTQPARAEAASQARFDAQRARTPAPAPSVASPAANPGRAYEAPPPPISEIDDFGAAFEEQFRRMRDPAHAAEVQAVQRQAPASPARTAAIQAASAGAAARPLAAPAPAAVQPPPAVSERNLEDKFAAAFAEELEIGADEADPAAAEYDEEYADEAYVDEPYDDELPADEQDWEWEEDAGDASAQTYRRAAHRTDAYGAEQYEDEEYEPDDYDAEQYDEAEYDAQEYEGEGYYDDAQYEPEPLRADEAVFENAHRNSLSGGSNRGLLLAGGALAIALLLGGAALGFSYFTRADNASEPLVISADPDPVKVKPADAGGAEIANQDTAVYDRVSGGPAGSPTQETLINNAEKPVDVTGLGDSPSGGGDTGVGVQTETGDIKAEQRLQAGELRPSSIDSVLAPRRVATLAVKPDGSIVQPAEPAAQVPQAEPTRSATPAESQTTANGAAPGAAAEAPAGRTAEREPLRPIEGAVRTGKVALPVPRPTDGAENAASTPLTSLFANDAADEPASAPASGEWAVQLASQRSQEDAQATFQNLKRRFPAVLGNQQMSVQRADVEGKGVFFRVRVTAATREDANTICQNLRAAGGSCFVTR